MAHSRLKSISVEIQTVPGRPLPSKFCAAPASCNAG